MTVAALPLGYTSLTPFICVAPASAALESYTAVFGATLVEKMDGPAGSIAHAELDFGSGRLQLSDPSEKFGLAANDAGTDIVTHSVMLYCADVDDMVARAQARGATTRAVPQDFATGDRFASILDPFGIRWTVMTRVMDLSAEERERRLGAWAQDNVDQPG